MASISAASNLDHLKCPITQGLPLDPVQTNCGHIFDRVAIRAHLENSKLCPFDGREITVLNSQVDLKAEIHAFIRNNADLFENKTPEQLQTELHTEYEKILADTQLGPLAWLVKEIGLDFILSMKGAIFNSLAYGGAAAGVTGIASFTGVEPTTVLSAVALILFLKPTAKIDLIFTIFTAGIVGFAIGPSAVVSTAVSWANLGGYLGFSKGLLIRIGRRTLPQSAPIMRIQKYKNPAIAIGGVLLAGMGGGPVAAAVTVSMLSLKFFVNIFPNSRPRIVRAAINLIGKVAPFPPTPRPQGN